MTPEEFIDWLLGLTAGIPSVGEFISSLSEFAGIDKIAEFLGFTVTLFNSLVNIFSKLIGLIEYGFMIYILLLTNFHIFILTIEIFIIGLSVMKSTEPIDILSSFFKYNYSIIAIIIKNIVGMYKMIGIILYNLIKLIPTK